LYRRTTGEERIMPRRRSKKNRMPNAYYKLIEADSPEAAEQEALAHVLEKIAPDTIDEWEVTVALKRKGDPTKGDLDLYDTKTDFHRVVQPRSI
jgi:hypothetical protein